LAFHIVLADDANECFQDFDIRDHLLLEDFIVIGVVGGHDLIVAIFILLYSKLAAMHNDSESDLFIVMLLKFDILAWAILLFICVISFQIENNASF